MQGTISVLKKLGRSWGNQGSHQPQVAMRSQMDTPFQHWEFSAFQWYSRTAARLLYSRHQGSSSQLAGAGCHHQTRHQCLSPDGSTCQHQAEHLSSSANFTGAQARCGSTGSMQTAMSDLFKAELGCLKDFELDVKFKADAKPVFCKPRVVPFAIQEDLSIAYDAGIARGVWQSVQFNNYGTPVVPIRKVTLPGQTTANLRVCEDYSVTVNPHPIPRPEDLMQKLGGGYGFTKIDLSDAYNQIMLTPESQRRLALSTHRGVLLQMRLPFGISSEPGYFQEIMDMLTSDLKGIAVYMDDILVSGTTTAKHLQNLKSLLKRLEEKGLQCRLEKCLFANHPLNTLATSFHSREYPKVIR